MSEIYTTPPVLLRVSAERLGELAAWLVSVHTHLRRADKGDLLDVIDELVKARKQLVDYREEIAELKRQLYADGDT